MSALPMSRAPRWPAFTAASVALATDVLYLVLIWQEGRQNLEVLEQLGAEVFRNVLPSPFTPTVIFIGSAIAVLAIAAVAGVIVRGSRAAAVLTWAAVVGLLGLGILGIMSIGLLLLVAGAFALGSAVVVAGRSPVAEGRGVAAMSGALGTLVVVVAGLWLSGAFR